MIKEKGLEGLLRECLNVPDALARTNLFDRLALLPLAHEDLNNSLRDKPKVYEKWLELIRENSELRKWVLELLEEEQGHRARSLENVKKAIKEVSVP